MKPEAALHRAVAAFLRVALKPPTIWTTIPAGGGGRIRGAQLKAMGLQRGWPDILVIHPADEGPLVVGIELKASKGRQSAEQKAFAEQFEKAGGYYFLCRSVEDVDYRLWELAIPLHASVYGKAAA